MTPADGPDRGCEQPLVIRVCHWLNVPLLFMMSGSGLQILMAHPFFGPRGRPYDWYPLQGFMPPAWLRLGHWLAGARALHFASAWIFLVNGLVYVSYVLVSKEWRRRFIHARSDFENAWQAAAHYLRLRREAPEAAPYNGLQRIAYTTAMILTLLTVLSGFAIWKPVMLAPLTFLFGGYDLARLVHFLCLVLLGAFSVVHVVMVLLHPRALVSMVQVGTSRNVARTRSA